jgi:hypothetical protein
LRHLKTIGYLEVRGNSGSSKDPAIVDPHWLLFDPQFKLVPVPITHGFVRPNWETIAKQFQLFDVPVEDTIDHEEIAWGGREMIQELIDSNMSWSELPLEEVDWNMKSSAGALLSEKSKQQWLANNRTNLQYIWDVAHKTPGVRVLNKVSGKSEYLPIKKVINGDHRCFEISPTHLLANTLPLSQPFNKQLYQLHDQDYCVGLVYQEGGFDRFARFVMRETNRIYGSDDYKKWDKRFNRFVRKFCIDARIKTYRGTMLQDELEARINFAYDQKATNAHVLLPWGQVVIITDAMLSGDDSTTADNSMGVRLMSYAYVKFYMKDAVRTYADAKRYFRIFNYADDHITSAPKTTLGQFLISFPPRYLFNAGNSMVLKLEDHVVQPTIEGLKFLGATFHYNGMYWVPVFDIQRIYSAVVMNNPNTKVLAAKFMKLVSLLTLAAFCDEYCFEMLRIYVLWFSSHFRDEIEKDWGAAVNMYSFELPLLFVPTRTWAQRFWLGLESSWDWRSLEHRHILDLTGQNEEDDERRSFPSD